jgi:hypothetical protein
VLDLLLQRDVPILPGNMKAWEEESPIYIASKYGHVDIIQKLVEKDPSELSPFNILFQSDVNIVTRN